MNVGALVGYIFIRKPGNINENTCNCDICLYKSIDIIIPMYGWVPIYVYTIYEKIRVKLCDTQIFMYQTEAYEV